MNTKPTADTVAEQISSKHVTIRAELQKTFLLATACLALSLTGCFEKRVVWSPDGKLAAILGDDGLFLCDDQGALSGLLVERVSAAAWLPGSKELILAQQDEVREWAVLAKRLAPSNRDRILASAGHALDSLRGGAAWEEMIGALKHQHQLEDNEIQAVQLCLRDTRSDDLKTISKVPRDVLRDLNVTVVSLRRAAVDYPRLKLGSTLAEGLLAPIHQPRSSPDGKFVAFSVGQDRAQLFIAPSDGSASPVRVDEHRVSIYFDWTPDGRALTYVRAMGEPGQEELALGVLTRREVRNDQGALAIAPAPEDLAGLLFDAMARVRCLRDGRVLFSSTELSLPLVVKDAPQRQQLFALASKHQAVISRLIPDSARDDLPDSLNLFEISPDEKRLAIADDKGRVYVLTLATAEVAKAQPNDAGSLKSIPDWKSSDELCFVNIVETDYGKRLELALRNGSGKVRALSRNWPVEATKGLLDK